MKSTFNKIEYDYIDSDNIVSTVRLIKAKIDFYMKSNQLVKFGISGAEPQLQFNKHLTSDNWDQMVITCSVDGERNAMKLEDYIISCYPEHITKWLGISEFSLAGNYYFYFLLKRNKKHPVVIKNKHFQHLIYAKKFQFYKMSTNF